MQLKNNNKYKKVGLRKSFLIFSTAMVNLFLTFLIWPHLSYAQTSNDQVQASGQTLFCKRDFSNFLSNGIDFDGEGLFDYWGDIIDIPWVGASRYSANVCHFTEIDSLLNRIENIRKQLRQAFYVCDKATTAKLTTSYYELSAELYYLRHFINTKPGQVVTVVSDRTLRPDFIKKFGPDGTNYFSSTEATVTIYEKFQDKYKAKLSTYQNCEDSNIGALKLKVQELGGLLDNLEKLGQNFSQKVKKQDELSQKRIKQNSMFSAENGADFINRVLDFKINGDDLTAPTVWEQISNGQSNSFQTLKDNSPSGVPSYTFFDAENDIIYGQTRDTNKSLDLFYATEYELLYKNTGDQVSSESVVKLDQLKTILEGTYPHLQALGKCTSSIVDKQCSQ